MSDQDKGVGTLVEVLSALMIIFSLAAIAIPKFADVRRRDTASRLLTDIEVVRSAVYAFYSDSGYFPLESPDGSIPENLTAYLPENFSFWRSYGTIEYKNWPGATNGAAASNVIGATVTTRDPRIAATAAALSPGTPRFTVGDKFTFVFFGS